jgi:phosphatidylserine/phosphatidylglycerophosphate/cardiolipin synthase-like enzyme
VAQSVETTFLEDGGQPAARIAELLTGYLACARRTLDIAIYDLRLEEPEAGAVRDAIHGLRDRGVAVRVVFNVEPPRREPVPPPPRVDWDLVKSLGVPFHPVRGAPDLMHHKYAIVDAGTPEASVLTGSTNWTNDSWTREENAIVRVDSADLADAYARNFEELWTARTVVDTGRENVAWSELGLAGEPARVRAIFSPGRGRKLTHEIAQRIESARTRVRICSPVLSAGSILGTVADVAMRRGIDIAGVLDATQVAQVREQWGAEAEVTWKLKALDTVLEAIPFAGKRSTPYAPGSVHDFMHAKVVVADDSVFVGSYNLSASGMDNAENVLEIENAGIADTYAGYVDRLRVRYPPIQNAA